MINAFLKYPCSIKIFLMSIIGPKTRKPNRAPEQKVTDKLFAMTASDEEQSERRKESRIAAKTAL